MPEKEKNYGEMLRVPDELIQVLGKRQLFSFETERENILYSVAFRNLSAKTQVFHSDITGHLRTRLTHTLEVARIAMDMAETLGFDKNLAEVIALGHDLGHTPFGHVGERAIHRFSSGDDRKYMTKDGERMQMPEQMRGFKHNLQSVRLLVDYTEGCEFSNFVLYGIREHSSLTYKKLGEKGKTSFYNIYDPYCSVILEDGRSIPAWSVEAFLVKWADEIAQRHHDIEDAYFQKIMSPHQIIRQLKELYDMCADERLKKIYEEAANIAENYEDIGDGRERERFVHYLAKFVTGIYVSSSIEEFRRCIESVIEKYNIESSESFAAVYRKIDEREIKELFSLKGTLIAKNDEVLNSRLKYAILDSYEVQRMDGRSEYLIRRLLRAYKSNPQQLPDLYIDRLIKEEIYRFIPEKDVEFLLKEIREYLGYETSEEGVRRWQNYECRNALRILLDNKESEKMISPVLMRVIFDFVSFMTDRFAYEEYKELYE